LSRSTGSAERLERYRQLAITHETALWQGDHIVANAAHDDIQALARNLHVPCTDFLALLKDHSPAVRLWAASHALQLDRDRAESALEDLVALSVPGVSFDAEYTLQEWRKGRLKPVVECGE